MCLSMMWYWVYFFCLSPIFSSLFFRSLSCVVELSMPTVSTSQDLLTSKLLILIFAFFESFKSLPIFQGTFKLPCSQPSTLLLVRGGEREGGRKRERGREGGRERGREGGEGLETNEEVLFIFFWHLVQMTYSHCYPLLQLGVEYIICWVSFVNSFLSILLK